MLSIQFERRWQEVLDRRELPEQDDQLCRWAEEDSACREMMDAHLALTQGLQLTRPSSPSVDFSARVLEQFNAQVADQQLALSQQPLSGSDNTTSHGESTHRSTKPRRHVPALALAVAAGLLLAVIPAIRSSWWHTPNNAPKPSIAESSPSAGDSPTEPTEIHAPDEATQPAFTENSLTVDRSFEQLQLVLSEQIPQLLNLAEWEAPSFELDGWTRPMRPLASPMTSTLRIIRRTFPGNNNAPSDEPQAIHSHLSNGYLIG